MGFLEEESPLVVPQRPAAEAGRKKLAPSEQELMRKEFSEDKSIIAYEIASYLYACCLKYALSITLSS